MPPLVQSVNFKHLGAVVLPPVTPELVKFNSLYSTGSGLSSRSLAYTMTAKNGYPNYPTPGRFGRACLNMGGDFRGMLYSLQGPGQLPFTVEFFNNIVNLPGTFNWMAEWAGLRIHYDGSLTGDIAMSTGYVPTLNAWNHIAVCRVGNVFSTYVNGALVKSKSTTSPVPLNANSNLFVGGTYYTGNLGKLDHLRITVGTSVYDGDFTPPDRNYFLDNTMGVPSFANVVALLPFEDGIYDVKGNTVTNSSGLTLVDVGAPYGSKALLFVSGKALTVDCSRAHAGDFSEEFWWYPTSTATQVLLDNRGAAGYGSAFVSASGGLTFYFNNTASLVARASSIKLNEWNKVVVSRSGSSMQMFVNGEGSNVTTFAGALLSDRSTMAIGHDQRTTPTSYATGYIKDVRIVDGATAYPTLSILSTYKLNTAALPQS